MPPDVPIACTLGEGDLSVRQTMLDRLAADALLERTPTATGLKVRLRGTPEIERRARDLVAAESECCPFLAFDLARDGEDLVLEIAGPPDARPVIETFFARAAVNGRRG